MDSVLIPSCSISCLLIPYTQQPEILETALYMYSVTVKQLQYYWSMNTVVQFYALSHLWWYFLQRFCSSLSQGIKIARHHHIVLMKFITKFEQSGVQFAKNFLQSPVNVSDIKFHIKFLFYHTSLFYGQLQFTSQLFRQIFSQWYEFLWLVGT